MIRSRTVVMCSLQSGALPYSQDDAPALCEETIGRDSPIVIFMETNTNGVVQNYQPVFYFPSSFCSFIHTLLCTTN